MNRLLRSENEKEKLVLNIAVCFLVISYGFKKFLKSFSNFSNSISEKFKETMDELDSFDSSLTIRELTPSDAVGIDSLPEQEVKKRMKEGFVFNVLLVGESGIGKSTLGCSLFNILPSTPLENHMNTEVKLHRQTFDLREKGVNLKLTIVETTGYGDQINRTDSVVPLVNYIESQFEMYFKEELKMKRFLSRYHDTRIHACLYFICPTGHNLKSLDIFCMKQLHDKVNIIPIVAKSDSISKEELQRFKKVIRTTIANERIKIYPFPTDDEELADTNSMSNELIPFAVAASSDYVSVEGKLKRARVFPWGTMLVEDEEHSEFSALKHALINTNMENMREKTHDEYFEFYRRRRMTQLGCNVSDNGIFSYQQLYKKQRKDLQVEMLDKEEKLKEKFIEKVRVQDEELKNQKILLNNKYRLLFEQLKGEEENLQRLKNMLESEIISSKKKEEIIKRDAI